MDQTRTFLTNNTIFLKDGFFQNKYVVLDVMRQSACLVLNLITVSSYGFLFNCMTVGQASDIMSTLT